MEAFFVSLVTEKPGRRACKGSVASAERRRERLPGNENAASGAAAEFDFSHFWFPHLPFFYLINLRFTQHSLLLISTHPDN